MTAASILEHRTPPAGDDHQRSSFDRRPAIALGSYRVVAGCALAAHFVRHAFEIVPWISGSSLVGERVSMGWPHVWLASAPPSFQLRAVFIVCALLGLLIALGIATRVAAATLYTVSVATYWAVLPIANLDDYLANLTTLMLLALPNYQGFRLRRLGAPAPAMGADPSTSSVTAWLVCILCLYVCSEATGLAGAETKNAKLVANALRIVAIGLVIPAISVRRLAVAVQICLHTYLLSISDLFLTHLVLGGSAILFWARTGQGAARARVTLDAGGVVSAAFLVVIAIGLGWGFVDPGREEPKRMVGLASNLGLFPVHATMPSIPDSLLTVQGGDSVSQVRTGALRLDGVRLRTLASRLAALKLGDPVALAVATAAVRQHCERDGYPGKVGTLWCNEQPVLEFECGTKGSLAYAGFVQWARPQVPMSHM